MYLLVGQGKDFLTFQGLKKVEQLIATTVYHICDVYYQ